MENIKISVIIPVYNVEKYLEECLESIVHQSLKEIEIICVDDGSTDGSVDILKRYACEDKRFILRRQKNQGGGAARNLGLACASGEYVVFLDSDDFFEPEMFRRIYDRAMETAADIVLYGGQKYDTEEKKYIAAPNLFHGKFVRDLPVFSYKDIPEKIFTITTPAPWTKLFRRDFIKKEGLQFQCLPNSNDVYFVLTSLCLAERIAYVDEVFVNYRIGMANNTQSLKAKDPLCFYQAYMAVYRTLVERGIFAAVEKSFADVTLSGCVYNLNTIKDENSKKKMYDILSGEEFLSTRILDHPVEFYDNKNNYYKVKGCQYIKKWSDKFVRKKENKVTALVEADIKEPLVSVIIPVYNTEKYLHECLESVSGQTLNNIEILCMNDGSTDHSLECLRQYSKKEGRLSIYSQANAGQSVARNECIRRARGKYLYFMDSDDVLDKDALKSMFQRMEKDSLDIIFCDGAGFCSDMDSEKAGNVIAQDYYQRVNSYPEVYSGKGLMDRMWKNKEYRVSPCLQMIHTGFFRKNDLWFVEGIIHEDNAYTYKSLLKAERVGYVDKTLFYRRIRPNSTMTNSISFKNVYGYFVCYLNMSEAYKKDVESNFWEDEYHVASEILYRMLRTTRTKYFQLDEAERYSYLALSDYFRTLFQLYVADLEKLYDRREINELREKLQRTYDEKSEINRKLQITYKEKYDRGIEIKQLKQEVENLKKEIKKIKQSKSYQMGTMLAKPYWKLKKIKK